MVGNEAAARLLKLRYLSIKRVYQDSGLHKARIQFCARSTQKYRYCSNNEQLLPQVLKLKSLNNRNRLRKPQ
ncbi:hypothetical protein B4P00_03545 [Shewanella xiamenensis]|nr:hypothetical protein AEA42_16345 [Shewanella sp. Sh95]MBW0295324.1 hypothetical protein [Shewanella xiamenensis]PWH04521.1 hypothetical protein DIY08_01715 [Shewanella xiamenensis]TVL35399.1 hypothetical protein AYI95_03430 [Shewanella xiamenensis]